VIGVEDLRPGDRRQEVEAGVEAPGAQEVGAGEVAAREDAASRIVHLHQPGNPPNATEMIQDRGIGLEQAVPQNQSPHRARRLSRRFPRKEAS